MKKILLSLTIFFSILQLYSQKESGWKKIERNGNGGVEKNRRSSLPLEYKLFEFDYQKFKSNLNHVPSRENFSGISNVIVSIPNIKGDLEQYRILEASNFEADLQNKFPEIRSYVGQGISNPSNVIRFSLSPYNGISAIIRSGSQETTFIIDPISTDHKTVIIFDKLKSTKSTGNFICSTEDAVAKLDHPDEMLNYTNRDADDSNLRVFKMAQSCTGEYANYFGATSAAQVNLVLAAYNATYTRVNAIFEADFNCTMQLIANTTDVIYYNPATDPYSDAAAGSGGAWNGELGSTLQSVIGNANYHIGHLFGADGGGGNAGCIGCVCSSDNSKGQGFTSPADGIPEGDNFDVDYVAHEIGHQLGGNHTFSMSSENNAVNMEPGSGVTIMGYAGITGATDVANHSIPIFHAGSIQQITTNIKSKSCPTIVAISNAVPVPSTTAAKTLPRGTAFKLIGTATDADAGDVLSYCWEQVDDATTVGAAASYPSETKTNGPNFRSFMPKNNGVRHFPRLEDHVANGITGNQWEIIPNNASANRILNFRLTVRDNHPGGGNNKSTNVAVTFDRTKGPFLVTSQSTTGISYTQGSSQTITWSVNSTNTMTGAANVNIKLSTDGGQTFPITLVSNTPNDGTQNVIIPNIASPYCRILIEPTGNDFYAINTNDFAIGYTVTTTTTCNQYPFTPNLAIPDGQAGGGYGTVVGFTTSVPAMAGTISDVNILNLNVSHTYIQDVVLALNHPDGTQVLYVNGVCTSQNGFNNLTLDSQAASAIPCSGNTNTILGPGTYQPSSTFNVYNGKAANGTWTFLAVDSYQGDTGTLNSLTFEICTTETTIEETPNACGVITTTWNGSSWSNGTPLRNVVAVFNGNYTSSSDIEACSLVINSGANVVITSGNTFVITNEVTVNTGGTLTVKNNAALRQIDGDAVNTGDITVEKSSAPMIRLDYTAWASPVIGQQLLDFSPNTIPTRFYEYLYTGTTTPTAYQSVDPSTNFISGKGYMIRVDNNWSSSVPTVFNSQYDGVPYNGDLSASLGKGYNLIGNPYASPIDADRFLSDNATTVGALYFWTHTVPASGGAYPANNYASYTTLGGTASAAGGSVPNGVIQTGQGFYVRAYDFGNAIFSNEQRLNASSSTQFFRSANTSSETHRFWLNLNGDTTPFNQILIGYKEGATSGFDTLIDGKILDNSNATYLYSIINAEELVIQGKGLPFDDNDIVTLGLKVEISGTYSINLENMDGLFDLQNIYLKDKYLNVIHDIKQSSYSFSSQAGIFEDRFEIVYKDAVVLDIPDFVSENAVIVFTNNSSIVINSEQIAIQSISIFDVLGRALLLNKEVYENSIAITTLQATNQALFVKITLNNNQVVTKKIIF
ncbi:reprolysin-like metallopeptidase [Flavobacterium sp. J27]|uniref:reprolysin-like metallopeptidase n=1 Tax=Flavobacterium sp. J27 TaxID=2060419 RepID=UPI001030A39A|nr:zinc-dependent metalloprotease family protein [Flavobacterium sp. J27]